MAGIKGYRVSIFSKRRHEQRTQRGLNENGKLWTDAEVHMERLAGMHFGMLCEKKRQGEEVQGAIGKIRVVKPFTLEEGEFFSNAGFPVPLDLWPSEWWDRVRERDCPDTLDPFERVMPMSEEAFYLDGRGGEF